MLVRCVPVLIGYSKKGAVDVHVHRYNKTSLGKMEAFFAGSAPTDVDNANRSCGKRNRLFICGSSRESSQGIKCLIAVAIRCVLSPLSKEQGDPDPQHLSRFKQPFVAATVTQNEWVDY